MKSFNTFHDTLLASLDNHYPERTVQKRGSKSVQPWNTKGLRKSITKQRSLYKTFVQNRSDALHSEIYKKYKQCLQKTLRYAKTHYYSNLCMKHKSNTKKLWGIINGVLKKVADKTSLISCRKIDKILVYDSNTITNEFGKYFTNVGKDLAKKTTPAKKNIYWYISKINKSTVTMFLHPTNELEIAKLIEGLTAKTSSGHNNISNSLLKKIKEGIVTPLNIIINSSLQEEYFPSRKKMANVVPLFKSKNKNIKTNYRPISLLLTLSKVLEKVVYTRTYNFMKNTSQIYDGQFGFRSKHSWENAIQNLVDVIKGEDNGLITTAVFLDLSKVFDTLSHPILFAKLSKYGI